MPERVTEEKMNGDERETGRICPNCDGPFLERFVGFLHKWVPVSHELPSCIANLRATIDRQQRVIAGLAGALQPFLKFNSSEEWTELKVRSEDVKRARSAVVELSSAASEHDRRVRAEAYKDALQAFRVAPFGGEFKSEMSAEHVAELVEIGKLVKERLEA